MRNKHFGSTYNAIHMMYFFYDPYGPKYFRIIFKKTVRNYFPNFPMVWKAS